MTDIVIRPAVREDVPRILAFIRELAEFEKLAHEAMADPADVTEHLFGARPYAEALMAEAGGEPAGFALFFHNYSTFAGKPGIYLEDLYVRPVFRGQGVGKRLISRIAALAVERGCARFEWSVLDWNEPAIRFYRSLGAIGMDEWTVQRLDGEALQRLAGQSRD